MQLGGAGRCLDKRRGQTVGNATVIKDAAAQCT
jgi:hypothetical protein